MKRLIGCGDRFYPHYRVILDALKAERDQIELLIEGECRGADILCRMAARLLHIPYEPHPAKWFEHGLAAGPIRNQEQLDRLLEYPGEKEVWAFHDHFDKSVGTRDMCCRARKAGVPVRLYNSLRIKLSESSPDYFYLD